MLDVILRTCDIVYSVHDSASEVKHRVPGPEFTKLDIMLRCINSLVVSMNQVDEGLRLTVIDDHSVGLEKIQSVVGRCKHPTEIVSLKGTGNGVSLEACYNWARDKGDSYLFFVEDDYLHDPDCLPEMLYELDFFKLKLSHEVALFPYDNIDNYVQMSKNNEPCFMALGSRRHWRTVTNTTSTFLCSKKILERYWFLFERMTQYGKDPSVNRDNTTNVIWTAPYKQAGGAYLLSPIPSLAIHFHFKGHIIPFIDWKNLWEKNKEEIKNGSRSKNCKDYS